MDSITLKKVAAKFGADVQAQHVGGDDVLVVKRADLVKVATFLRDDAELAYNLLVDLGGVDYLTFPTPQPARFAVAYQFLSMTHKHRVRIKVFAHANEEIPTLFPLWKSADWLEREVYDQYGLKFAGHPNMTRILNHHEFVGHPLRKDYPIRKRQVLSTAATLEDQMLARLATNGIEIGR